MPHHPELTFEGVSDTKPVSGSGNNLRFRDCPLADRVYDAAEVAIYHYSKQPDVKSADFSRWGVLNSEQPLLQAAGLAKTAQSSTTAPKLLQEAEPLQQQASRLLLQAEEELESRPDGAIRALDAALEAMDKADVSLHHYADLMEEGNRRAEVCNQFLTVMGQLSEVKSVDFNKIKDDKNKELLLEAKALMEQLKEWGLNWQRNGWESKEQRQALVTGVNQMMDMGLTKDQKFIILLKNAFTQRNQFADIVSDMEKRQDRTISKMSDHIGR